MTLVDLRHIDFQTCTKATFKNAYNSNNLSDVTLVTEDDQIIPAHRLILSSSSPFFENIFTKHTHPDPMIYLHGISHKTLQPILEFVYLSKTQVMASEIETFINVSRQLQIKGISDKTSTELQTIDTNFEYGQLGNKESSNDIKHHDELPKTILNYDSLQEFSDQICETVEEQRGFIETETVQGDPERSTEIKSETEITEENKHKSTVEPKHKTAEFLNGQERAIRVQQIKETYNKKHITTMEGGLNDKYSQMYTQNGKELSCNMCDYECKRMDTLRAHLNAKHNAEKFPCQQQGCGRIYSTKANLRGHMKSCHDCPQCDHIAESNPNLKVHKRMKHDIEY